MSNLKSQIVIAAIAAITLTFASCNDDVQLSKFKIDVDVTLSSIYTKITPPADSIWYWYGIEYKSQYKREPQYYYDRLQNRYMAMGADSLTFSADLLPNMEYVIYVCEADPETSAPIGEMEYLTVRTPNLSDEMWTDQSEEQPMKHLTGTIYDAQDGSFWLSAEYENGVHESFTLDLWLPTLEGSYNFNNLVRRYLNQDPFMKHNYEGPFYLNNASFSGRQDKGKGSYVYDGTIDVVYFYPFNLRRYPIHIECVYVK